MTTVYSYDDSGRLISSASPNAGEHKTVYDAAGRPVLETAHWSQRIADSKHKVP
ncbi:hypothetical protein HXS70_13055 [Akkermansia muciniphila]|nr:hypothetical protein HXS70_13055 [Akkermansia muciniphila]